MLRKILFLGLIALSMMTNDSFAAEKQESFKTGFKEFDRRNAVADAIETPLFESAVNYASFPKLADCEESGGKIVYYECINSADIYESAVKNAKAKKQPLMVVFGFNTCPACLALEKGIFQLDPPPNNGDIVKYLPSDFVDEFKRNPKALKISLLRIHSRSDHGLKLANDLGVTEMAKSRGWHRVWSPFILFVNPQSGDINSESYWEAEEVFCDYFAEFAANIDALGMVSSGEPYVERERCKN